MDIIFYHPTLIRLTGLRHFRQRYRGRVCVNGSAVITNMQTTRWCGIPGRDAPGRKLKAVFALGAGVDSILSKLKAHPEMLPEEIPCSAWKIPAWASKCRNMP